MAARYIVRISGDKTFLQGLSPERYFALKGEAIEYAQSLHAHYPKHRVSLSRAMAGGPHLILMFKEIPAQPELPS